MSASKKTDFDLVILGGGAAGFAAAIRADELGFKAIMLNSGLPIGGTCVNVGCIPTKFLLEVGNENYYMEHPQYACNLGAALRCDFPEAIRNKDEVVRRLRNRNYQSIVEAHDFEYLETRGKLLSGRKVKANDRVLKGRHVLIATGSSTEVPPIRGLREGNGYLTNESLMRETVRPDEMMILGGGPLGLEFAQMYLHFGSRVTLLESADRVLPREEPEVSESIALELIREGLVLHTGVRVREMRREGGRIVCKLGKRRGAVTCEADQVLVATGFVPNTLDLGLSEAGVELAAKGFVKTDVYQRTSVPGVWAAGDVTGHTGLETVAAKEGALAASNALRRERRTIDYDQIPHAVFTSPQVASVGLTEAEMERRGIACECRTVPAELVPKALTVGDIRGLLKMVIEAKSRRLRGVHVVSPIAADMIHAATYALRAGFSIDDLIDTVHAFPTFSEAIKIAAQSFYRDMSKVSCCIE